MLEAVAPPAPQGTCGVNRQDESHPPGVARINQARRARVDDALRSWRQGDCVLGDQAFLFRLNPVAPISEAAAIAAVDGADAAEAQVHGFAIVTQTCDIVRACGSRPFVQVCPLVEVDADKLAEIRRGRRPNYAFLPGTAPHRLVADLDRVMTVEKAVVADWDRVIGVPRDEDIRHFRLALTRNRGRVAFPDDFVQLASQLTRRMSNKHEARSEEGRALRALREIRVRADPSWRADEVSVLFLFVRDDTAQTFAGQTWDNYLSLWLKRVAPEGRFTHIEGVIQTLDDLTGRDYVESDPLDLDHLSTGSDRTIPATGTSPSISAVSPGRFAPAHRCYPVR